MATSATAAEVTDFLNRFKVTIDFKMVHWKGREKTDKGLEDLNLNRNQALQIIQRLTPNNYVSGPSPDDTDESKIVWMFGVNVDSVGAYIKLRIDSKRGAMDQGIIWSFHPQEFPLRFPLAPQSKGGKP